jgi:hypothetical protein
LILPRLVVTFRWCCVRVKAPEIALVGFDHSANGREQLTPSVLGCLPNNIILAVRFLQKIRFFKRRTSIPVRFRLSFSGVSLLQRLSSLADNHQSFTLPRPLHCSAVRTASRNSQSPIRSRCSHCRKSPFETHAFGNLEGRDQAAFNLLPAFAGSIASRPVFSSRPVKMSGKFVVLASLELRQQLLDGLLHLSKFGNERFPVHYHEISRYPARWSILPFV